MKLPQLSLSHLRSLSGPRPQVVLRLDGPDGAPQAHWWIRTTVILARGRCRLRWFRLTGIPAAERMSALRLQVEAWRPFENLAARLVLSGEDGLAIAWDGAAAELQLLTAGQPVERCQFIPETLLQLPGADGLRLLSCSEGFEAQCWQDGWLRASRWWSEPLTSKDWQEFVHASGPARGGADALPQPEEASLAASAWAKHYPLHAAADGANGVERRLVFGGALALTLTLGTLAHQLWNAHQHGQALAWQMADVKTATASVLGARDATLAAVDEVDRLAAWFALPLPVDVIGYLHDALGRSGVQIKDLDLEGDKLRLGLQLMPNATRAGIVKDLQAGGWFVDVAEVRADNARGLLTMEMRIVGLRPPVDAAAATTPSAPNVEATPPAVAPVKAAVVNAPAVPVQSQPAPAPVPVQTPARPLQGPPKPIVAKPDANGMPPPDVFNAIPNR